jgi:hypothetical protein
MFHVKPLAFHVDFLCPDRRKKIEGSHRWGRRVQQRTLVNIFTDNSRAVEDQFATI